MSRILIRISLLSLLVFVVAGCVTETTNGNTTTFSYEWWAPVVALLGGIVAVPVGLVVRKSNSRFGWGLVILGPLAAIGFAPTLFLTKATLDDKSYNLQTGIWGMTAVHSVNFDDLRQVRMIVETTTGRRGRKNTNYYLMCERKDGTSAKIPLGNAVAEKAGVLFLQRLAERQIPIIDQTNN